MWKQRKGCEGGEMVKAGKESNGGSGFKEQTTYDEGVLRMTRQLGKQQH